MKINRSLWFISLLILCLVTSCTGSAKEPAKKPLKVEWTFWQGDYNFVIAQKMGLFEKYGVNVELVRYDTSAESIPDLAGARLDGGIYTMSDLLLASNLVDIKGVMVTDNGGVYSIVSSPEITSVDELRGKRIGLNLHTTSETFIAHILSIAGMTTNDVTFVDMDPQQVIDDIPYKVDAGLVWEPYTSQAVEKGETVLFQSSNISSYITRLITFRKAVLDERPDDVRAFLRAWDDATYFRIRHPSESVAILSVATGLPGTSLELTEDISIYNSEKNNNMFRDKTGREVTSIYYIARYNLNYLINLGYITTPPDISELLDSSYLK